MTHRHRYQLETIVAAVRACRGRRLAEIAARFGVALSTLAYWRQKFSVRKRPRGRWPGKYTVAD